MTLKDPMEHLCRLRKYMSLAEIARQLTVITGSHVHRNQVGQWLHPKRQMRVEPRLKQALAMMSILAREEGFFVVDEQGVSPDQPKR